MVYEMDGEVKSLNAWARQYDKNPSTIWYRIHDMKMTLKEALTTEVIERSDSMETARKAKLSHTPPEKPIGICDARCKRCKYGAPGSGIVTCDYHLIMMRRRPCPAGKGCTEFKPGRKPRATNDGLILVMRRNA